LIVKDVFQSVYQKLSAHGIEDAYIESRVLIMHVLNQDIVSFHLSMESEINTEQLNELEIAVDRRMEDEPISYITGRKEFYGLDLIINNSVLIPRPETELLVKTALDVIPAQTSYTVADIGTGSGAIAIAIAKNRLESRIYAVDISRAALEVARINCDKHGVSSQIHLLQGILLEPVIDSVKLIVANLPYINHHDFGNLDKEIRVYEPEIALYGGKDGLGIIRELLQQVSASTWKPDYILLEIGYDHCSLLSQAVNCFLPRASIEIIKDYNSNDRLAIITGISSTILKGKSSKINV
jgi:release factor glutamine methyltransferase